MTLGSTLNIRSKILQWVGLPVCVGIGATKTLAKLANHVAKKVPLFNGVCDFSTMSPARKNWLLMRIDVGEVWGVGKKISARLHSMGITTVQQLTDASPKDIRAHFGVVMERTCSELNGISCLALEEVAPARKEIISSRSFGNLVQSPDEIIEAVSTYVARASEKLRGQHSVCGAIHVFIQTNPFRQQDKQYSNGLTIPLVEPTDDHRILTGHAINGINQIFRAGFNYKKAGIVLMNIMPNTIRQHTLFDSPQLSENSKKIMSALDGLNQQYGRDTIHLGSAGVRNLWAMKSENRTPRYTTNWNELPTAHAN